MNAQVFPLARGPPPFLPFSHIFDALPFFLASERVNLSVKRYHTRYQVQAHDGMGIYVVTMSCQRAHSPGRAFLGAG